MTIHSRRVVIGAAVLIACATTSHRVSAQAPAAAQITQTHQGPPLLLKAALSDRFESLTVIEGPDALLVSLAGPSVPREGVQPPPLSTEGVQVWLLKRDGTAIAHLPGLARGAGSASGNTRRFVSVGFKFRKVAAGELAGVVLQTNGKLLVFQFNPA